MHLEIPGVSNNTTEKNNVEYTERTDANYVCHKFAGWNYTVFIPRLSSPTVVPSQIAYYSLNISSHQSYLFNMLIITYVRFN